MPQKDPCQQQACAVQKCLQAQSYAERRCEEALRALRRCCELHAARQSACCSGFTHKHTGQNTPDRTNRKIMAPA